MENTYAIDRFEAFELHKAYREKAKKAESEGSHGLAESYRETSQKWLGIACEIERNDSDNVNRHFAVLG